MYRFKWIDWNLQKIASHQLSSDDVEAAFDRIIVCKSRRDGSFEMYAEIPSGRRIWVVWRYDRAFDPASEYLDGFDEPLIFVITAY